jgi:hypothetical protein
MTNISITTPVVSALNLKNYYIYSTGTAELSKIFSGYFRPLLGPYPYGGFTSKTVARRFQNCNGRYVTASELKRLQIITAICNGNSPTDTSVRSGIR